MANPSPDKTKGDSEIDLNTPEVESFMRESVPKIKALLTFFQVDNRRDPMLILQRLAHMLGREIEVRPEPHVEVPYVTLGGSALSLRVPPNFNNSDIARYKAIVHAMVRPELVKLVKELDRVAQDQLLVDARKGLQNLDRIRQVLGDVEFEPVDKRLLAGIGSPDEKNDVVTIKDQSGGRVIALLDGVFNQ